jgi:hypothetical protein
MVDGLPAIYRSSLPVEDLPAEDLLAKDPPT